MGKRIKPFADRISKRFTGGERPLDSYLTITPMQSCEEGRVMTNLGQFSAASGEAINLNFLGAAEPALSEAGTPSIFDVSSPRAATKENGHLHQAEEPPPQ